MSTNALQVAKPEATQYFSSFVCEITPKRNNEIQNVCMRILHSNLNLLFRVVSLNSRISYTDSALHEFVMNERTNERKSLCYVLNELTL